MKKYLSFGLGTSMIVSGLFIAGSAFAATAFDSLSVSSQSGFLTSGTAGHATYTITVNATLAGRLDVDLSVIAGLPSGVSASFSPARLTFLGNGNSVATLNSTLTLTTSISSPGGTYNFTIQGVGSDHNNTVRTIAGTLTIDRAGSGGLIRRGRRTNNATSTATTTGGITNSKASSTEEIVIPTATTTEPVVLPIVVEHFKFLKNLRLGMKNSDVLELQNRLISEGFLTASSSTGYFGQITKRAVITYQEKFISNILTPLSLEKGTGFVGPYTRGKLNSY